MAGTPASMRTTSAAEGSSGAARRRPLGPVGEEDVEPGETRFGRRGDGEGDIGAGPQIMEGGSVSAPPRRAMTTAPSAAGLVDDLDLHPQQEPAQPGGDGLAPARFDVEGEGLGPEPGDP